MLEGYIASSADGFVADSDGGVGFLDSFNAVDYGYEDFFSRVDSLVMGRRTFDQVAGFDIAWPYAGKDCHVITSSDLTDPPEGVHRWQDGLQAFAEAMQDRTVWVLGGAKLQSGFIAAGLLGRLNLFVMPVLLGKGVPLFAHDGPPVSMRVHAQTAY